MKYLNIFLYIITFGIYYNIRKQYIQHKKLQTVIDKYSHHMGLVSEAMRADISYNRVEYFHIYMQATRITEFSKGISKYNFNEIVDIYNMGIDYIESECTELPYFKAKRRDEELKRLIEED